MKNMNKNLKSLIFISVLVLSVALNGCSGKSSDDGKSDGSSTKSIPGTEDNADRADLMSIVMSNYNTGTTIAISPEFDSDTLEYTVDLGENVVPVTIIPLSKYPAQAIYVEHDSNPIGGKFVSGEQSKAIDIHNGENTILLQVLSPKKINKYTISIYANSTTNAYLSNITLSAGSIAFNKGTFNYSTTVSSTVETLIITPQADDPTYKSMTINGTAATSGSPSSVPLAIGNNTITIVVTAADLITQQTYTLNVRRYNNNANLSGLTVSSGTLSPVFNENTIRYAVSITDEAVTSITATPTASDSTHALITVNNNSTASGGTSSPIALIVGSNMINIIVTAEDGITIKSYIVTVTKTSSETAANLSNLTVSAGTLLPVFNANTSAYAITVPASSFTITPTALNSSSSITINGVGAISGNPSSIDLEAGNNTVNIVVTNGTASKQYTLTVYRPSDDAYLSSLVVNRVKSDNTIGTQMELRHTADTNTGFETATTGYYAYIGGMDKVSINPTAQDAKYSGIKVNGSAVAYGASSIITLTAQGETVINVVVTAEDGITTKTYSVTVNFLTSDNWFNGVYLRIMIQSLDKWYSIVPVAQRTIGLNQDITGNISGNMLWKVIFLGTIDCLATTADDAVTYFGETGTSYCDSYGIYNWMKMTAPYNDGNALYSGTTNSLPWSGDWHIRANEGGHIMTGDTVGSITDVANQNGLQRGIYTVTNTDGVVIATIYVHYVIASGDAKVDADSFVRCIYMPGTSWQLIKDYLYSKTTPDPLAALP